MAANIDDLTREIRVLTDNLTRMLSGAGASLVSAQRNAAASLNNTANSTDRLKSELASLTSYYGPAKSQFVSAFDALRKTAADETNRVARAEQFRMIDQAQEKIAKSRFYDTLFSLSSAASAVRTTFSTLTSVTGGLIRGFQDNADAFKMSNSVISGGLTLVSKGASSAQQALVSLGVALFPVNKALSMIAFGGSALAFSFDQTARGLNFTLDIFSKEVEKTVSSFTTLVSSGALYARGLTEMREQAKNADMTLYQFSNMVKASAEFLSQLGTGIAPAAKRVGDVLKLGSDTFRLKLMNLGFSIEEQGSLVAEVMRDMRQSTGQLRATDPEILQATERYAENLRILAAITGQDGKKRMEQARQAANNLAFQQKLAGMDEKQRQNVIEAMANMSDVQRKNFMDTVLFGTVINKEGAAAAALSQGLNVSVQEIVDSLNAGTLTADKVREIQQRRGKDIERDLMGNKEVALAAYAGAGGIVQGLNTFLTTELEFRKQFTPEAIAAAKEAAAAQKNTQDEFTTNLNQAQISALKLAIAFETIATTLLPYYSKITEKTLTGVSETLADVGKFLGAPDELIQSLRRDLYSAANYRDLIPLNNREDINRQISSLRNKSKDDSYQRAVEELKTALEATSDVAERQRLNNDFISKYNKIINPSGTPSKPVSVSISNIEPNVLASVDNNTLGVPVTGMQMMSYSSNDLKIAGANNTSTQTMVAGDSPVSTTFPAKEFFDQLYQALKIQNSKFDQLLELDGQILTAMNEQYRVSRDMLNNSYA